MNVENPIIGIDEVGLGPCAGPCAAAAVLIEDGAVEGVRDSKLVAEEKRYELGDLIRRRAPWSMIAARGADAINATRTKTCHRQVLIECALAAHEKFPDARILLDWTDEKMQGEVHEECPYVEFIRNGDDSVYQIAAASLVAKAYRDRLMLQYDMKWPAYGFKKHKGYPTPAHLKAIREFGECEIHRHKAVAKCLSPKSPMIKDPAEEVADYPPAKAIEYVVRAKAAGLEGDWETKFVNDLEFKLNAGLDLSPRQKFFLKRAAHTAEHRAKKKGAVQ
jgi:ribonuclease HII